MSRIITTDHDLGAVAVSDTFVGYERMARHHTVICSKGTATAGTVEVNVKIGDGPFQKVDEFTISALAPITFSGSYDEIQYNPSGVDGDGFAINANHTD